MPTVALVGGAHIHTPGFVDRMNKRSGLTVKAVWDHHAHRASVRAEALGGAAVVSDLDAIWNDASIDGVIIASETDRHEDLVLAAAAAQKHMFVEKPLGLGAKDSARMAAAIVKAGVKFQTGYFMRGNPVHLFVREQVAAGAFGKITRVRHSNCHSGSLGGWFDERPDKPADSWRWMADPKIAGCGAFGDLGTHVLDILLWLFGDVESCTASIHVVTGRYGDCDESGEGILRFANGAVGTLAAGWVDVANSQTLMVSGTEGYAHVTDGKLYFKSNKVQGADGKEPWTQLPEAWPHAFDLFLDALEGKDVSLVDVSEAARRVSVMAAMYEGARTGQWVRPA